MLTCLGFDDCRWMEALVIKEVGMGCVLVIIAIGCAFTGHPWIALGIVGFLVFVGYK